MRSRIAVTAMLATGALMSSGGAAIGVSALSTTSDASQAQYGPVQTTPGGTAPTGGDAVPPGGATLGDSADSAKQPTPSGDVRGATDESGPAGTTAGAREAQAQPARQLESSSADELPFTGYAAIPLLLVGLALLASGLVLRRSTSTNGRQLS